MGVKAGVAVVLALVLAAAVTHGRVSRMVPDAAGELRPATAADFQAALDSVQPGQTIVLGAGQVYRGPFHLPQKTGDAWVTIRTSTPARDFPPEGARVGPDNARDMPTLTTSEGSVISADPGAHHYRFVGIEIAPEPGVYLENVIDLGTGATTLGAVPHDFDFQRCYVHGDPTAGSRRGIALNSASTSIVDSYFSDFKERGFDSQAICGWNGPGPFTIHNNYLEGAGENLMFGGADPTVPNLVPANIDIRNNHFSKPPGWRPNPQTPSAPHWTVKNLLELKNAEHVVIDGNVFENNWLDAQVGFAILFTPRNQDGNSPWSVVDDVTFSNNIVRHVAAGVDIIGTDDIHTSRPDHDIRILNNLFTDVGGSWGFGRLFELLNGTTTVTIQHNTATQTEIPVFGGDTTPHQDFVFEDNIVPHNTYGFLGSGTAPGKASIDHYFPGSSIRGNVIAGGTASELPPGNFFPATLDAVGFVSLTNGDFHLTEASPFHGKATDGHDPGVDPDALDRAIGGALTGRRTAGARAGVAIAILWGAFILIGYTYVGYPALMWMCGRLWKRRVRVAPGEPYLTLLVVAHNEADRIAARVENLLAQDYPADRREVVVVSDGSTDQTAARARAVSADVHVIERLVRQGKAAAFNDVIPRLRSEIVVLCDARQRFEKGAIRALAAHFADPVVGAVSGQLLLQDTRTSDAGSQGAEMYWSFEKRLRWWESLVDSTIGVTGAIAAVRRGAVGAVPADTIIEDVLIPMRVTQRGLRVTFEPKAIAYDRLSPAGRDEFARKVRTLAGNFQLFARERWLLVPWRNRLWLQTVSHKGLRLVLPLLFAAAFAANGLLVGRPFYRWTFAGQVAFYGLAWCAGAMPTLRRHVRVLVLPYAVCFLAWATVVAFVRFMSGQQSATWDRIAGQAHAPSGR